MKYIYAIACAGLVSAAPIVDTSGKVGTDLLTKKRGISKEIDILTAI
jgi:hypothetical protein